MESVLNAAEEIDRIAARIEALCDAATKTGRPYFISALGNELGEDLRTLKLLTKAPLTDFVRSRLSKKYELVQMGEHGNVSAIIPLGGEVGARADDDGVARDGSGRPKFHYRLWAAFSVPPAGQVRYLNMNDLTFEDYTGEDGQPEGTLPIPVDLIAPEDAARRDDMIWENLSRWLADNGLPPERFYAPSRKAAKATRTAHYEPGTVLELVLASLDRRQLQTTHLSLDVVAALLQARRS